MRAIKQAITKAVEGGYELKEAKCHHVLMHDENGCPFGFHYEPWHFYTSDPSFWQALGKELGWVDTDVRRIEGKIWRFHWHRFIDHLAEGKDAESFFATLLPQEKGEKE